MDRNSINSFYLTGSRNYALVTISLCKFLYGFASAAIAPLLVPLGESYGIRLEILSLVFAFSYLGQIIIVFFIGFFADKLGRKIFHISFIVMLALTALSFTFTDNYILFLMLFLLMGLFGISINMMSDSSLLDIFRVNRGYYLNIAHVFFGLGAITAPLVFNLLFNLTEDPMSIFMALTVCSLVVLLLIIPARYPADHDKSIRPSVIIDMLKIPRLVLINVFGMLAFGTVLAISGWMPTLFQKYLGVSASVANYSVSFFWIAAVLGRILAAFVSRRFREIFLIRIINVIVFLLIAVSFFLDEPVLLLADYLLLGFFMGTFTPLVVTYSAYVYDRYSSTRLAITFAAAALGMFSIPTIVGALGEYYAINKIIPFTAVFFLVYIFIFWKVFRGQEGR